MATEQSKPTQPTLQEHPFPQLTPYPPPTHASQPQHVPPGPYPPPGTYPQYYPYPPPHPTEGNAGDGNNSNGPMPGPQFVVPFPPPGVVYTYHPPPPGQTFQPYSQTLPAAPQFVRPKRKQVKMACTNCASACKRCDEHRPCERCTKFGLTETCMDGQRKERKKGIKRGPYKRKNKPDSNEFPAGSFAQQGSDGEWSQQQQQQQNGQPQAHPNAVTTTAAIHAVAQFAPEGYPYYYPPPPPGFMPPMGDGQQPGAPGTEGGPNVNVNGQPQPMVQYYMHPSAYAPFGYYPHPGAAPAPGSYPQHPGIPIPQAAPMDPAATGETQKKAGASGESGPGIEVAAVVTKKKTKASAKSGEGKTKRTKSRAQKGNKGNGGGNGEGEGHQVQG